MKRVLAIDQSYTSLGYCWGSENKALETLYGAGHLTPGLGATPAALSYIYGWLTEQVQSCKPDLVIFEQYAFGQSQGAQSAELGGVIKLALTQNYVDWRQVGISQVKKWAIPGESLEALDKKQKKERVKFAAYDLFGKQITLDDEADAAWMAHLGIHYLLGITPPEWERQCVLAAMRGEKPPPDPNKPVKTPRKPAVVTDGGLDGG